MKKPLYKIAVFIGIMALLHVLIVSTNNSHLYPTLRHTLLKGKMGPSLDEYLHFPYRVVAPAKNPLPWVDGADKNTIAIKENQRQELETLETVALLVIKGRQIILEEYTEGYNPRQPSNSFSMAKSFVGMAIGAALQENKIKSLDDPVVKYLPWYGKPADAHVVTIRHLLTMSSGINFDEHYINPFAFPARANYGDNLKKLVHNYRPDKKPGQIFDYQSGNTQLLALLVEAATGESLSEYFSKKIWQPIGAMDSAYWSLDRELGVEKGFCCFNSNARDFARIGRLFLDSGRVEGIQVLPEKFVKESVTPANLLENDGTGCRRYGFQWWLWNYKGHRIFYARGIKGQYIICMPALDMVVVRLGHKRKKPEGFEPPPEFFTLVDIALQQAEARNK